MFKGKGFSNIALIKYMGKSIAAINDPTNASLSLTLPGLFTEVQLTEKTTGEDDWSDLDGHGFLPIQLSEKGKTKFLNYLKSMKQEFGIEKSFSIRSANNFPSDCGIASSASSFSALTLAFAQYLKSKEIVVPMLELALLSKKGSGSSCRSFFGPWTYWKGNEVCQRKFSFIPGWHQVVIVDSKTKNVSSSEAHLLVTSSSHFLGRVERAESRLQELSLLLAQPLAAGEKWNRAFKICWDEFMDMHHLFHTAKDPFFYWSENTVTALKYISELWKKNSDGPLVTMDAGPNLHLIYRNDQQKLKSQVTKELSGLSHEPNQFTILETELHADFRI